VAFVLMAPVALVACGGHSDAKDVTITSCKSDPVGGHPTADGTVTNKGSSAASYQFNLEFRSTAPKAAVSTTNVFLARVASGETAQWHADSTFNPVNPLTCGIATIKSNGLHLGHAGGPDVTRANVP
jgi:hypothetical protein